MTATKFYAKARRVGDNQHVAASGATREEAVASLRESAGGEIHDRTISAFELPGDHPVFGRIGQ